MQRLFAGKALSCEHQAAAWLFPAAAFGHQEPLVAGRDTCRLGSAKGAVRGAPGWGTGAIGLIRCRLTERLADDLKQA